jgi:periplasmic protein TonB
MLQHHTAIAELRRFEVSLVFFQGDKIVRTNNFDRRHQTGAAIMQILVGVIGIALIGSAAGIALLHTSTDAPVAVKALPAPRPGAGTAAGDGSASDSLASLSVDQLFKHAQSALNEQRLVAPAGNNAFEFYLQVLERDPKNSTAKDALREIYTFAQSSVEQQISERRIADADRSLALLTKADAGNYTLTILRGKLEVQRKAVDRETQQRATAEEAARRAAENALAMASTTPSASTRTITPPRSEPVSGAESTRGATVAAPSEALASSEVSVPRAALLKPVTPEPVSEKAAASTTTSDTVQPQLVQQAKVKYPTLASRQGVEGWVDIELTVRLDGSVDNPHVVQSQPSQIFDRAALDAVHKWKFKPAVRNGNPVETTTTTRISFKM